MVLLHDDHDVHVLQLQGIVPADWKKAMVTPILRRFDPANYRPISLTSISANN